MITIWKYPLELTYRQTITIPRYPTFLTAQMQGDTIVLWAQVITESEPVKYAIEIAGTGHELNSTAYIATVQQDQFVWHIFNGGEVK